MKSRRVSGSRSRKVNKPQADRVQKIPLAKLEESSFNWKVYQRDQYYDHDYRELENSIRKQGQLEPILVSEDYVIISGHRRCEALRAIGSRTVKAIVLPIKSSSPRFRKMLLESNTQRDKDAGEILREQLWNRKPVKAEEVLAYRYWEVMVNRGSKSVGQVFEADSEKRRAELSPKRREFLAAVVRILKINRAYLPMTIRQIHYQLLNNPPLRIAGKTRSRYRNDKGSYQDLVELLTKARLQSEIDFEDIHDTTRPIRLNRGSRKVGEHIRKSLNALQSDYQRDLMQSQPDEVVVICEKDGLRRVLQSVCQKYCVPLFIGRGYGSLTMRHDLVEHYHASSKQRLVILFFGDFDPEGENIVQTTVDSLCNDFGIESDHIQAIKVALTKDQIGSLPPQMKAKKSSTRYKAFTAKYGTNVWELDALPPRELQERLRAAIESVIDLDLFKKEQEKQKRDARVLSGVCEKMKLAVGLK